MDDDTIDFKELGFIFKKNILLYVLFFILIVGVVAFYTFNIDPQFEASSTVVIDAKDVSFGVLEEESRNLDVFTEVSIIESAAVMQPVRSEYGGFDVTVLPVKNSNLIEIMVHYSDPILVDDIANTIARSYVEYTASIKQENAEEVLSILSSRINTTQDELKGLNAQIFDLKEKRKRTFTEEFSYVQTSDSVLKAQNEYNYLTARKRHLEEIIVSNSATAGEKNTAKELLIEVKEAITVTLEEIESLQSKLLFIELNNKLSPEEEINYLGLLQSKSVKEQQLVELLSRHERVSIAQATAYASIVDVAVTPQAPSSPNIILNMLVGILLGVVGAFGLIYFKEVLRGSITNVEDIERITGLSVIGDLPRVKSKKSSYLIQHHFRNSPFSEKIRMLRTNVLFNLQEKKHNILLVTSASKNDGKTTTAINLAISLGHSKQKVLLIDANVRDPKLQDVFKTKSELKGLSDVILLKTKVTDAIVKSSLGQLDILFSGEKNDYPGELFTSDEMKKLLVEVAKKYDVVIIDSPPCEYSETSVLARLSKSVLFVVKHDKTARKALENATKNFLKKISGKDVAMMILRNYTK